MSDWKRGAGAGAGRDARDVRRDCRALTDQQLVLALRRGDSRALDEFFNRFRPFLLSRARRRGGVGDDAGDLVLELLEDTAAQLCSWDTRIPRSLAAWLAGALRHRLATARRDRGRRERREAAAPNDAADSSDGVVATTASEDALRISRGPDEGEAEAAALPRAVERLREALDEGLSDEERDILMWVANGIPKRTIAEWTGATYEGARKRVLRLRARLREAAARYTAQLDGDERREVLRFMRRAERSEERSERSEEQSHE